MDDQDDKKDITLYSIKDLPVDPEMEEGINLREIQSLYVAGGLAAKEIAERTRLPYEYVKDMVKRHKLFELRQTYLIRGIGKIQNKQIGQAKKLLDLEHDFKRMRLRQLESILAEFKAYYEKHGDFKKRHPTTGEILRNQNGIAIQLDLPTVTKEINGLKEGVTLSQGMKQLLYQLDSIVNNTKPKEHVDDEPIDEDGIIDMAQYQAVFKKKD